MKTLIAVAAALGVSSFLAVAQSTDAAAPKPTSVKRISAVEAEKHYDETVIVTGKVAQVSIRPKLTYINLDKKYPQTPMYCVVFARATNQFGDLKKLEGKDIEVKGKIEEYQSKAQIILNSSNQLTVIEKPAGASESASAKHAEPR
jgi:DNA/RNA endonuclease YhcR with UshA esterase domain